MKSKLTFFSLLMALSIAVLFVSGRSENHSKSNKTLNKIQPSAESQLTIENNVMTAPSPGVR